MKTAVQKQNLSIEDLLTSRFQLPFSYESIRVEEGCRPVGFRFSKHIINIIAKLSEREIIVCGEANTLKLAYAKAASELIERSALISMATQFYTKTSNGWAAHPEIDEVKINATLELVERDAVLSQWYSKTPFLQIASNEFPSEIQNWVESELSRSEFPKLVLLLSTKGLGPSVTCLLMNESGFGVSAHCAKKDLQQSITGAIAEACRAAHSVIRKEYWRDSLKLKNGILEALDPSVHGVYYAYHEAFPDWMFGEIISWTKANSIWQERVSQTLADSDFYFQPVMDLPIHVGFTKHPQAFELKWQPTDVDEVAKSLGAQRLNLKPDTINKKPHIVS